MVENKNFVVPKVMKYPTALQDIKKSFKVKFYCDVKTKILLNFTWNTIKFHNWLHASAHVILQKVNRHLQFAVHLCSWILEKSQTKSWKVNSVDTLS